MPYLFHGQRSDEEVVLLTHQHPLVLLHPFLVSACILLLPFLAYLFLNFGTPLAIILILALLASLLHAGLAWYSWNCTLLLLTNQRVVFLRQEGLLRREFSECGLLGIQQVSHEIKGPLHTLFGYGNILIYTGGAQAPFRLPSIPDPYDVQQTILSAAQG